MSSRGAFATYYEDLEASRKFPLFLVVEEEDGRLLSDMDDGVAGSFDHGSSKDVKILPRRKLICVPRSIGGKVIRAGCGKKERERRALYSLYQVYTTYFHTCNNNCCPRLCGYDHMMYHVVCSPTTVPGRRFSALHARSHLFAEVQEKQITDTPDY